MTGIKRSLKQMALLVMMSFVLIVSWPTLAQSQDKAFEESDDKPVRSGVIKGRVVSDGQPVADATVQVTRVNSMAQSRAVTSDNDGNFEVKGLEPGIFNINAHAPAYVSSISFDELQKIYRVGDSATINLTRGGVITGKIVNAQDEPVVAIPVMAILVRDANNKQTPATFSSGNGLSDDRGIYRLYGLTPGRYVVFAGGRGASYYPMNPYYPDAPTYAPSSTRDTANEISVVSGEEVKDVDIRYKSDPGHTVSGIASAPTAPNSPALHVMLTRVQNGISESSISTYQDTEGASGFEFNGVPDGEYDILAASADESTVSEPRRVTVKGSDVTGIQLITKPLASVAGQLILADSKAAECKGKRRPPYDEILITIQRQLQKEKKGLAQFPSYPPLQTSPDKDGNFLLRHLVPGQYALKTSYFAKYWYLHSVTSATPAAITPGAAGPTSIDATRSRIVVKPGDKITGIRVTLAEGAASFEGNLKVPEDRDIPSTLYVNLIPAERDQAENVLRYAIAPIKPDGSFLLNNIPPGRYFVLTRAVQDESDRIAALRPGDQPDVLQRLRREAEANGLEVELKPCQNMRDFQLRLKSLRD